MTNHAVTTDAAPPEGTEVPTPAAAACLMCGDPVDVPGVESEYCFQCAVHVKCSCAD